MLSVLIAFTAGLVLHPLFATAGRGIATALHDRKVRKALVTVEKAGWILSRPDDTVPVLGLVDDRRPSTPAVDGWPASGFGYWQ